MRILKRDNLKQDSDIIINQIRALSKQRIGERELGVFREDALSEKDATSAAYHPYGDSYGDNYPTAWDNFYNKWLALDLSRTGGFPSVLLGTLLVLTAPFTLSKIWIIDPILQKIRG